MRRLTVLLIVSLLLPAILIVAPAAGARAAPATGHTSARGSYDPIVGNWYRGARWFRVRGPFNGVYRAAWSNGSGALIHYKIKRQSTSIYYEVANPLNTYRVLSGAYKIRVHYETTDGSYVTRTFMRVE
jgi:hypothetical protein